MITTTVFLAAAISVFRVDPYHVDPHMPDAKPADAVETDVIGAAAARGEFESVSWLVRPETDLAKVDFVRTALEGPGGAKLPVSAIDLKAVKVWYQPNGFWTTTWAGNIWQPTLIPALVLHDDTLVRVDETNKINYVRLDYRQGSVYTRMSGPDRADWFNYSKEPLADAKDFVPFDLQSGRYKQYWLTYHVPMDQKPGTYKGKLVVKSGAMPVGEIKLELEVYPFSLPSARTHYDSSRPYMCSMMNGCSVGAFLGEASDLKQAELRAYNTYKLMADHNITHPHGPGNIQNDNTDDFALRTLFLMRKAGLPCKPLFAAGVFESGLLGPGQPGAVYMDTAYNPKEAEENFKRTEAYARRMAAVADKYLGHHEIYYYGIDEAQPWSCRKQYGIWSALKRAGGRIFATSGNHGECGWSIDCCDSPALLSHWEARAWHRDGGLVMTYAAPFTGPECPAIWRRTKGLRFYYSDFDGPNEYVFYYHARNRWNEFIRSPDGYRSFGIVYPCHDGMIGTVALEALREGIDDVRYLSLLRLRAEAAMRSPKKDVQLKGRRAIAWADSRDPERIPDLNAFRREVARRALELIALVGPEPDEPAVKPIGELPPHAVDRMAADETIPIQKRAEKCEAANRYDLAIPLYEKMRKSEDLKPVERAAKAVKESELRLKMLDRAGALAALDYCLKERGKYPKATYGLLAIDRALALLTPVEFCEHFSPAKLKVAQEQLTKGLEVAGVDGRRRYEAAHRMCLALLNSENPTDCIAFAEKCEKELHLTGSSLGTLLYTGVEAYLRLGKKKEAYALCKKVKNLGGGNLTGDARTISGTLGELAEGFGEYEQAVIYYSDAMKSWPPDNDVFYPRYKAALTRVSRHATKTKKIETDNLMEGGFDVEIKLDEE